MDEARKSLIVGVYATHGYYGCDSGCCGHSFHLVDKNGAEVYTNFEFDHDVSFIEDELRRYAHEYGVPILKRKNDIVSDDDCDY